MNETMIRMFSQLYGAEVLSFCVDYKQNGQDRHEAVQVTHSANDLLKAAHGVWDELTRQGKVPQVLWYVPGDHTMEELDAMMDESLGKHEIISLFVSENAMQEAREAQELNEHVGRADYSF